MVKNAKNPWSLQIFPPRLGIKWGWPSRPEASPRLRGVLDAYVDAARAPNHAVREAVAKTRRCGRRVME
jgi:hypothetical protein